MPTPTEATQARRRRIVALLGAGPRGDRRRRWPASITRRSLDGSSAVVALPEGHSAISPRPLSALRRARSFMHCLRFPSQCQRRTSAGRWRSLIRSGSKPQPRSNQSSSLSVALAERRSDGLGGHAGGRQGSPISCQANATVLMPSADRYTAGRSRFSRGQHHQARNS